MKLQELYAQVTSTIIKDLERGVATWVKPWKSGAKGGIMPYNAVTARGIYRQLAGAVARRPESHLHCSL
jgi:antirestriction protein ArdC